jgi:hypothetical protein
MQRRPRGSGKQSSGAFGAKITWQVLYVADDWGSSMGKWGGFFERDKLDSPGYEKQTKDFLKIVNGGVIGGYGGKHAEDTAQAEATLESQPDWRAHQGHGNRGIREQSNGQHR